MINFYLSSNKNEHEHLQTNDNNVHVQHKSGFRQAKESILNRTISHHLHIHSVPQEDTHQRYQSSENWKMVVTHYRIWTFIFLQSNHR